LGYAECHPAIKIDRQQQRNANLIVFVFRLSTKSDMTTSILTRSKLEHYGFNMLVRPASIRLHKRQSLVKENQNKRLRSNESRHSMQTRSQSSSVSFATKSNRTLKQNDLFGSFFRIHIQIILSNYLIKLFRQ
jgi:hypothetical protein